MFLFRILEISGQENCLTGEIGQPLVFPLVVEGGVDPVARLLVAWEALQDLCPFLCHQVRLHLEVLEAHLGAIEFIVVLFCGIINII